MEKVVKYRKIITELLSKYASMKKEIGKDVEEEEQLVIDPVHDHYQIMVVGWKGAQRIYYPIFHLDIKDGKIWVQEDATDFDIVGELEERGIPKNDIVLAFHAPYSRPYTGYAVA